MAIKNISDEVKAQFDGVSEEVLASFADKLSAINVEPQTGAQDTETIPEADDSTIDDSVDDEQTTEQAEEVIGDVVDDGTEEDADDTVVETEPVATTTKPTGDLKTALKQEREKTKKAKQEARQNQQQLEEIKNELAQLRGQLQQPQAQPQGTTSQAQAPGNTVNPRAEYRKQLIDDAKKVFKEDYNRDPDIYENENDAFLFSNIMQDIHANNVSQFQKQQAEQQRIQQTQQTAGQRYASFVNDITANENYDDILATATENIKALDPVEQAAIQESLDRVSSGKPTMTDVFLIKKLWAEAASGFDTEAEAGIQATPTATNTQQKVALKQKKIAQMQAHPKASQVPAAGTTSSKWTVAKVEQILKQPGGFEKLQTEAPHILTAIQEGRPF